MAVEAPSGGRRRPAGERTVVWQNGPMTAPARQPPTTEARIIDVATTLFYEHGYHATTMREIAAGVGMKAGSLYNHFPGKQHVLYRIAYDTMRELFEGALRATDAEQAPAARLRAFIEWHVRYHAERRYKAKVADDQLHALEPELREPVIAIRDEYEMLLRSLLEEGRDRDGWHVEDSHVITFAIATMSTAVGTWFREDGRLSPEEIARIYAEFILAGLTPR
jgi:AcrR family transcriptional regulator